MRLVRSLSGWFRRPEPRLDPAAVMLPLTPPPPAYTAADRARDYRRVFLGTDAGKRVLWDLLDRCRVADAVFIPGLDTHMAAARDGERNVARMILAELTKDVPAETPSVAETMDGPAQP